MTINTGSSSVRLARYRLEGTALLADDKRSIEAISPNQALGDLRGVVPDVVVHRVVHGGARLTTPCLIDASVEAEIVRLSALAPLHNPLALTWIHACREVFGAELPQVAVFDTAFFAGLPEAARTYALPRALAQDQGLRRYGFHGLAHRSMWAGWCAQSGRRTGRVISLQLGGGCSITASRDGVAQDTSMGFSPLEGLMMATRSGDLDPGLLLYVQRECGLPRDDLERVLNRESGLLGVSGLSGDMRVLLDSSEPAARLAVDLYCYRAQKYIGAYLAVLGGADAITFGGGVGEHAPIIRERILSGLQWAGITLDAQRNQGAVNGVPACISTDASAIAVWVMSVDESRIMAEAALPFLPTPTPK